MSDSSTDGIKLKVIWTDDHILEVRVAAGNGRFAGTAEVYTGQAELSEMADQLAGFPVDAVDMRFVHLGTFDPKDAGGGARFRFRCLDHLGHAVAEVELSGEAACATVRNMETARFSVRVLAASIDDFVRGIREMATRCEGEARLRGSTA